MIDRNSRQGFTLLEMVVVLAILAVVTALATREVGYVQDQQRFEASQRGLETIRDAVLADERAADGTRVWSGFVTDVGRLPTNGVWELWRNGTGWTNGVRRAEDDAEVWVSGGWRGPYLRLPLDATNLTDGWGNAFTSQWVTASNLWRVSHLGANGVAGGSNYAQDVAHDFPADATLAWVWGLVEVNTNLALAAGDQILVRVFHPDGRSESSPAIPLPFPTNQVTWAVSDPVPVGLRAVRAYVLGSGMTTNYRSPIRYVTLRAGTNGPVNLEINW